MRIQRFHTTSDGGSQFNEIEIVLANTREDAFGHLIAFSRPFTSPRVSVVELPDGLDQGWHCAPERQLVVVLDGTIEVETTDGETRRWRNGDTFLADDTQGRGHKTRTSGGPARLLFVPLAPDLDLDTLAAASA